MIQNIVPVPNYGARVHPTPFTIAVIVETSDWASTTLTLRRATHKQSIAGKMGHTPSRSGCLPVAGVLFQTDDFGTMPLCA